MLITLPNMSSGVVFSGMWLPRDLDILRTPSVPGSSGSRMATWGRWPKASWSFRPATTMLNSWSVPPICTSACRATAS